MGLDEHRVMSRAPLLPLVPLVPLVSFVLLLACTPKGSGGEGTTPPTHASPTPTTDPIAALDSEIVKTGTTATTVSKLKIRVDATGGIVKQSLYHDDAAAIPAAVIELAKQRFPGASIVQFETELYADRGRVYEVEIDDGGKHCEVAATAEGTEIYVECEVDPAGLSAEIKASVEKIAPGGKLLEAETKTGPGIEELTLEVEHGGRELYLRMRPDGTLIQALRRVPAIVELPLP